MTKREHDVVDWLLLACRCVRKCSIYSQLCVQWTECQTHTTSPMSAPASVRMTQLGCLLLLLAAAVGADPGNGSRPPLPSAGLGRSAFPEGFVFGTASSAYQYEGGAMEGGRGASIWDTFTHQHPDKIADRSNGDVAVDSYHRYREDVRLVKDIGLDAYRFSISWSRILPNGTMIGGVNREGVRYYSRLIDELRSKGLEPFATIFHWDLPQALQDKYGGFLSPQFVEDYSNYAEFCFREFGDRVKYWITFNEPREFCSMGYATGGAFAPGRCSPWEGECSAGDSGREPYIACHHLLLAHAQAVRLYREKYQAKQKGEISIALNSNWFVPYEPSISDIAARSRAVDFALGWFMEPLTRGSYPGSMVELVGDRLPRFSQEESELLKGSFDFIGVNYYTTSYTRNLLLSPGRNVSYSTDSRANVTGVRNGIPIGPQAASFWLYVYPQGLQDVLLYFKEEYGNPTIYITENGVDEVNNKSMPLSDALRDYTRIEYHQKHLASLLNAMREGAKVKGYFAWSLLDDFEWTSGYMVRFGLVFVDYNDGLKRHPKRSAEWFRMFLHS